MNFRIIGPSFGSGNTFIFTVSAVIGAAILMASVAGCSPSSRSTAADGHQPITGAFGWVFGQKLPDQYQTSLNDTGVDCYTYDTNGLFGIINVGVDQQRTICMIEGHGDSSSLNILDKETLVKNLSDKYGLSDHAASNISQLGYVESWTFGSGDSTVHLTLIGSAVTILYRFDPMLETLQQKIQQQKNQEFQTNIHGI